MNKPSKIMYTVLYKYLSNKSEINDFLTNHIRDYMDNPLGVFTVKDEKQEEQLAKEAIKFTHTKQDLSLYESLQYPNLTPKQLKQRMKSEHDWTVKYFDNLDHYIFPHTTDKDLVVMDTHMHCHILDMTEISLFVECLIKYLFNDVDLIKRIRWILNNKSISDRKLGRTIGMSGSQITRYRTGTLKIENMSIKNSRKINNYYRKFVKDSIKHYLWDDQND